VAGSILKYFAGDGHGNQLSMAATKRLRQATNPVFSVDASLQLLLSDRFQSMHHCSSHFQK
jgi:hypothetical protein